MTDEEKLEKLSKVLKVQVQENSIVIFKVPEDQVKLIASSLNYMPIWKMHQITPLVCPDNFEIIVVHGKEANSDQKMDV